MWLAAPNISLINVIILQHIGEMLKHLLGRTDKLFGMDCFLFPHLYVCVDAGPLDGVLVPVHDHGPRHHRHVLQHLLLHLSQGRHVREVTCEEGF